MMSIYEIFQFIQGSQIGTAIRESEIVFRVIESIHVLGRRYRWARSC